ncbi:glycosyltransferase [Oceanirhabdus sp. W0125-5]|uniref:glycosyltransferase n=1 Tax=Oceanirhabdus sp. W0125-5 TaxID=2999116 RepID=UPI0022F2DB0F|nr:glycosyltransferase [Oceanirhabdus sp. W0125-5]WBW96614.1 glycosyltransferase [Oceanirhabdus sp. W0125-5]
MNKLKILILIKRFDIERPKHKLLFDMIASIEKFAEVKYWHKDGDINEILKNIKFSPDFIFSYDIEWKYAFTPIITGLEKVNIPKGTYVKDTYWIPRNRIKFIEDNKIDLIFSPTKESFLKIYPQYESKFRWMPFSINPNIIKDWGLKEDIDFLLMGLFYYIDNKNNKMFAFKKGKYPFREAVYKKMKNKEGFVFIPHPGHDTKDGPEVIINEKYACKLNRSKIFFTCGSIWQYPVMKYTQALGCRTLLLAKPNKDILELGFKDGVNFIACDEKNFYEKAMYYLNNTKERECITNNGYNFVHTYHTNSVRAQQFIKYVEDFIKIQ